MKKIIYCAAVIAFAIISPFEISCMERGPVTTIESLGNTGENSNFLVAVMKEDNLRVRDLLKGGTCVDVLYLEGETALHHAAYHGFIQTTSLLLEFKANVNKATENGVTPLHYAVQGGHPDVVRMLLNAGAGVSICAKDIVGLTPLDYALNQWDSKVVEIFYDFAEKNQTLLYEAAEKGDSELVKNILLSGIDVDGTYCETPLYYAITENKPDVVKILLEAGADIERAGDEPFSTALHFAASHKYEGIVNILLKYPIDINKKSCFGACPLFEAAKVGHEGIVRSLLHAGANPHEHNLSGGTPMHYAALYGHNEVVKIFMKEAKVDVNTLCISPSEAEIECSKLSKLTTDQLLSPPRSRDDYMSGTPLHCAIHDMHSDTVNILLQAGADIYIKNKSLKGAPEWAAACFVSEYFASESELSDMPPPKKATEFLKIVQSIMRVDKKRKAGTLENYVKIVNDETLTMAVEKALEFNENKV
ncbi:MAG: ankyrin repeat domain-containing protein [Holosporaceae bacterium]|jgi:ankyrin repeat protein|nr:ankyrin repeat domain-containing protein [Holosporaceae bacterium]